MTRSTSSPRPGKRSATRSSITITSPSGFATRRILASTSTGAARSWMQSKAVTMSYSPSRSAAAASPASKVTRSATPAASACVGPRAPMVYRGRIRAHRRLDKQAPWRWTTSPHRSRYWRLSRPLEGVGPTREQTGTTRSQGRRDTRVDSCLPDRCACRGRPGFSRLHHHFATPRSAPAAASLRRWSGG